MTRDQPHAQRVLQIGDSEVLTNEYRELDQLWFVQNPAQPRPGGLGDHRTLNQFFDGAQRELGSRLEMTGGSAVMTKKSHFGRY